MGGFFSAPFSENVDFTYSTADLLKNQTIISDIRGERIKEEMKKVKILKDTIEVLQKRLNSTSNLLSEIRETSHMMKPAILCDAYPMGFVDTIDEKVEKAEIVNRAAIVDAEIALNTIRN